MNDNEINLEAPLATRIALAVERFGEDALVKHAIGLLRGRNEGEETLLYLGGRHARGILDGAPALYWPEVWGARALLHVWDDSAAFAVLESVQNQAWRVREMCLKVCAVRKLGDAGLLKRRLTDENARVRASAAHALAAVGTTDDSPLLEPLLRDPDKDVRRAAGEALKALA
ncbi:HEAT repeat domain-containing protein [Homoserinimonas sp. A447]